MRTVTSFLILIYCISSPGIGLAQDLSTFSKSPVKLEYVVAQNADATIAGSFVVKNNYSTRDLSDHEMLWELSLDGKLIQKDIYQLSAIKPTETKYIDLDKLFDSSILDAFGGRLITLYAEIQDGDVDSDPIRIVGESVVLAEAAPIKATLGEQYQVVTVVGARIHRIANGNSITIDAYNQIVGLDLGEGNVLAGPIRPILSFNSGLNDVSAAGAFPAQSRIDSKGPTKFEVQDNSLSGYIAYDLDSLGKLKIPFSFSESGLTLGLELLNPFAAPTILALEVPIRQFDDSLTYFGNEKLPPKQVVFGDTRLGLHSIPTESLATDLGGIIAFRGARDLQTPRADIGGKEFSFQLMPHLASEEMLPITKHSMGPDTKILQLKRDIQAPRKTYGTRRKPKPFTIGAWLLSPKSIRD